jgi:hypothetical protein
VQHFVPNDTHFTIAKAFVEAGFNVICEKQLAELVGRKQSPRPFLSANTLRYAAASGTRKASV